MNFENIQTGIVAFDDEMKFGKFLDDKEKKHTKRTDVKMKDIKILNIESVDEYSVKTELESPIIENFDTVSQNIEYGTQLFVQDGKNVVPVRECALPSIYDRIGLNGPALERFSKDDLADILTKAGHTLPDDMSAKAVIVDDGLNALLSAGYVPHPASDVFRDTEVAVWGLGDNIIKFSGWYSYEGVVARFETDRKIKISDSSECNTVISMSTSDIGRAAVSFTAGARDGKYTIPLVNAERVLHKNGSTKEDIQEKLNMVIASISKAQAKLDALKDIQIEYPITTAKRLAKTIKLPKKPALIAIERWRLVNEKSTKPVTAFDLYIALCKTEIDYKPRNGKVSYVDKMHNNLLKLLGMSFKDYDIPGEFNW